MIFDEHINVEGETIKQFEDKHSPITITKILNDSFSVYDFEFLSAGTHNLLNITGICEAKNRSYSSTHYDGVLIELQKLNDVCQVVATEKDKFENLNKTIKGYYLVKYTDVTLLFDLESVNLGSLFYKKCPITTATNGKRGWKMKAVLLLPIEDAILSY